MNNQSAKASYTVCGWRCLIAMLLMTFTSVAVAQDVASPALDDAAPPAADANVGDSPSEASDSDSDSENEVPDDSEGNSDSGSGSMGAVGDFFNTPPLSYLFTGGIFMWPILVMGIVGAGVIIERFRSLKMLEDNPESLRTEVVTMLNENRIQEAFEYCNQQQGPVPAVLATGLRKYIMLKRAGYEAGKVEEQVVKSMDDYSVHIIAALERHLPILATISSAAPMLGFLGTVQGMIVAFDDIVQQMGETNIVEAAASGIKVSLMTTCFGLIVGIPAFVAFNYFTSVINRFVLDVEESATELVEVVTLQRVVDQAEQLG